MLIKEYRIPLPLTVEEYRIAQLYMIAKKSREESSGAGSGVEIIINEPYSDGPGGSGQYTRKIYHVGSHLPGWLKGILPKTALMVEEEAWNAYPYTKTRYTCPFVEKFSLEIETYYYGDNGHQDNVFDLSASDLRNRIVDLIDVVKDQLYGADYVKEEDPKLYRSEKSGRGPLSDNWLEEYWLEVNGREQPLPNGKCLMCAYKLCRVEFRYWGMQTKIERFIHDVALRKTMLRAHRQAWAWQDEWHGLTMNDIREIEKQTQLALQRKMGQNSLDNSDDGTDNVNKSSSPDSAAAKSLAATLGSIEMTEEVPSHAHKKDIPIIQTVSNSDTDLSSLDNSHLHNRRKSKSKPLPKVVIRSRRSDEKLHASYTSIHSPNSSIKSFEGQTNWNMESIRRDSESGSDEEFFDCQDNFGESSLAKWSSLELLNEEAENGSPISVIAENEDSFTAKLKVGTERGNTSRPILCAKGNSVDASCPDSPNISPCPTSVLLLVFHAGSVLDANVDKAAKKSDVTTLKGAFESVMRQHYPTLVGHIAIKLVPCPPVCTETLGMLSSLSPYSFDMSPSCTDAPHVTQDSVPIGAIPLFITSNVEYQELVARTITKANNVYHEFLKSEEGNGFTGQVCIIGDSVGAILAYDSLCRNVRYQSRHGSESSVCLNVDNVVIGDDFVINEHVDSKHLLAPQPRRRSSSTSDHNNHIKLEFEVTDFFMFGSPLALVLAYRRMTGSEDRCRNIMRPGVHQVYNLFHPTDPVSSRLEPLISSRFAMLPPVNIARYVKYPLGNGQPYHLLEILQSNPQVFNDTGVQTRRLSDVSIQSGIIDDIPLHTVNAIQQKWWGTKRIDFALYCPEGLSNFPTNALPHLFHASYWESCDAIAFILRQVGRFDSATLSGAEDRDFSFTPCQPREKWIRKRTSVKLKNVAANHRANDVIVRETAPQTLTARFMYGPLDMITLTGEKIDIHILKEVPAGEWCYLTTELTDKNGRVSYTIPEENGLHYGIYPVKMVVRGDHTSVDFYMVVVPPKTECVVFSIDGSFTASMSVTGKDPKVRAGAVDVVRHWQELGYLIIYTTGRPDMQQQKVVSWLSQHNFPHGLVSFADGLTRDPLGHKTAYLNNLVQNHGVIIHAAYGSSKDITVYSSIGLKPKQIYIVGKASKKQQSQAVILTEGYAAHLALLMTHGGSRPAQGNARMVIPRGCFGLPGQSGSRRRRSAKRTTSYPLNSEIGILERSLSARRCPLPRPTLSTIANNSFAGNLE